LLGAAAGFLGWRLSVWAREYCDAGWEAGGRLEMTYLLPVIVLGGGVLAPGALALARRLVAHAPAVVRVCVPLLLVVVVAVSPPWWFFATRGTLDDYPGDSGRCPASNVPPQWPRWLPA
jgi:hypothetical protein